MCSGYSNKKDALVVKAPKVVDEYGDKPFLDRSFYDQNQIESVRGVSEVLLIILRVPDLRAFWDLEKTLLHEIRVSGTVGGPLLKVS